jgi:hypothetical protein
MQSLPGMNSIRPSMHASSHIDRRGHVVRHASSTSGYVRGWREIHSSNWSVKEVFGSAMGLVADGIAWGLTNQYPKDQRLGTPWSSMVQ